MIIKMKSYVDKSGDIWQFPEDGSEDDFIPKGLKLLDDEGLIAAREAQEKANAPTPEQLIAMAIAQRDSLLAVAALRIAPLQDAVDLETSTDGDTVNLKLWKQYRVAVSRVSAQEGFPAIIDWPAPPS